MELVEVNNTNNNNNKAGQLKYYVNEWKSITSDKFILNVIQGYIIPFLSQPQQLVEPSNPLASSVESEYINTAISHY
jgi:hypothetical protein